MTNTHFKMNQIAVLPEGSSLSVYKRVDDILLLNKTLRDAIKSSVPSGRIIKEIILEDVEDRNATYHPDSVFIRKDGTVTNCNPYLIQVVLHPVPEKWVFTCGNVNNFTSSMFGLYSRYHREGGKLYLNSNVMNMLNKLPVIAVELLTTEHSNATWNPSNTVAATLKIDIDTGNVISSFYRHTPMLVAYLA